MAKTPHPGRAIAPAGGSGLSGRGESAPGSTISVGARMGPGHITLTLRGNVWRLERPADLESLWDALATENDVRHAAASQAAKAGDGPEAVSGASGTGAAGTGAAGTGASDFSRHLVQALSDDERLPYWVELWPASLSLAWLMAERAEELAGRICLDLGCGMGFTALAAARLGARVIGMDYELEALSYARRNTVVNNIAPPPLWCAMDWRAPALKRGCCDYVFGGDIMYETRFVTPVFDLLDHVLAPEGRAWLAEPGRNIFDYFRGALLRRGWRTRIIASDRVEALHTQPSPVRVNLWEITRK